MIEQGSELNELLVKELSSASGYKIDSIQLDPVSGGDISQSFRVTTNAGEFFLKLNDNAPGNDFFEMEANGLAALSAHTSLNVPHALNFGKIKSSQYLLLNFVEKGNPGNNFWQNFGKGIAELHHSTSSVFGWESDNYIGNFPQQNASYNSAADFYSNYRIMFPVQKAFEKKLLDSESIRLAERLCIKLKDLIPEEPPSLLHGDLWNGNFMADSVGQPSIFDPAVYYGHRETDIAMTLLFGGFHNEFYQAYNHSFPLVPGWQQRVSLFQLYPLLIHLNLFGSRYRPAVIDILKKFS